jgi:hypothetical protein
MEESEEEESDEEDLNHDEIIFGNVTDLMISLAKALGE